MELHVLTLSTRILADVLTGTLVLIARQVSAWQFAKSLVCRSQRSYLSLFASFSILDIEIANMTIDVTFVVKICMKFGTKATCFFTEKLSVCHMEGFL